MVTKSFQRLPQNVIPVNYTLQLKPDLQTLIFEGIEEILIEVKEATDFIVLNSREIIVQEAFWKDGEEKVQAKITYDSVQERVIFSFDKILQGGYHEITVKFTGKINDELRGFYRSTYKTATGEQRNAAITHFEATGARRAFPCWDEPAVRATFDITLVIPADRIALSNMPVKSETISEEEPCLKVVNFERTPRMSTYLVAFIVGEYDFVEATDVDGIKVRVYTPLQRKEQGQFALQVAVKTLPFYEEYFQCGYNLPKVDLVAVADFPIGAMENWGLVIYRETALLIDSEHSSANAKQWVSLIVGHELAHNWFGNLVTMEWWTHLWLKEGFASWIEYLCVDHCFPEYDVWTQFVNLDLNCALTLDALETSHPIEIEVGSPSEVDEIFDAISYSKGASIIRMLHDYIGNEDFRKGMNLYLTRHQYSSACTEDLWRALEEASSKPVTSIMRTWTLQKGFPVLKVSERRVDSQSVLEITQEMFSASGNKSSGDATVWNVPISFSTKSSPTQPVKKVLMDTSCITVTLDGLAEGDWVKLNLGTIGVYRVQYTTDMLKALIPSIRTKVMLPTDRLGIQNDLFALSRAGLMDAVEVLKVVEAYSEEDNFTVWNDLLGLLSEIELLLQHTDAHSDFKRFICDLLRPTFQKVGWEKKDGEGHLTALLRELIIRKLGANGEESVILEAKKRFQAHCDGTCPLPGDLRKPVYVTVLIHGDQKDFEAMLKLYHAAELQEESVRISRSLGCVTDKTLISKVLDFAVSDAVRSQDSPFVIGSATGSIQGRELAWKFVKDNFDMLHKRYSSSTLFARLVKMVTYSFVTEEKAEEIEAFFKNSPASSAARTVRQACENIRVNAKWLARESQTVTKFLKGR